MFQDLRSAALTTSSPDGLRLRAGVGTGFEPRKQDHRTKGIWGNLHTYVDVELQIASWAIPHSNYNVWASFDLTAIFNLSTPKPIMTFPCFKCLTALNV